MAHKGCVCCRFAAKAAKYGPLQGFFGGAGGGAYRGKIHIQTKFKFIIYTEACYSKTLYQVLAIYR